MFVECSGSVSAGRARARNGASKQEKDIPTSRERGTETHADAPHDCAALDLLTKRFADHSGSVPAMIVSETVEQLEAGELVMFKPGGGDKSCFLPLKSVVGRWHRRYQSRVVGGGGFLNRPPSE